MDPNTTLREMLELARQLGHTPAPQEYPEEIARLAELVMALDEWLRKGGAPPLEWTLPPGAQVIEGNVDLPEGHVPDRVELGAWALVKNNGPAHLLRLSGLMDRNAREECRAMIKEQLGAEAVWFEDERGTPLDRIAELPARTPEGAPTGPTGHPYCPQCAALGQKRCPVHGKKK